MARDVRTRRAHLLRLRAGAAFAGLARYSEDQERDESGRFGSGGGGSGGGGKDSPGDKMSQEAYGETYEVYDGTEFGDSSSGQGYVYSMTEGDVQIAFENSDGSTSVFADLTQDEANGLAENVVWAGEVDTSALGDRGPDPDNGLMAWKDDPATGLLIGPNGDGGVSIVDKGKPSGRIDMDGGQAGDLAEALFSEADKASDAETQA